VCTDPNLSDGVMITRHLGAQCSAFGPNMRCAVRHEQLVPDRAGHVTGANDRIDGVEDMLTSLPACTCSHRMSGLITS